MKLSSSFEKLNKLKIALGFAGLLLAVSGIVLFNFGQTPTKVAADTSYSESWQASKVYQLRMTNNTGTTQNLGGIGVSEWTVSGTIGSTTFSETWSGPSLTGLKIDTSTNNKCNSNGYDKTKWLVGCTNFMSSNEGTVTFNLQSIAPSSIFAEGGNPPTSTYGFSGGASYCDTGTPTPPTGCVVTTGAYGFNYLAAGGGTTKVSGLFMPLQWTVSGTVSQ